MVPYCQLENCAEINLTVNLLYLTGYFLYAENTTVPGKVFHLRGPDEPAGKYNIE